MDIQTLSKIFAAEDSEIILKKIMKDIFFQGLSIEETSFILSQDKNTVVCRFLSAIAYSYLGEFQKTIQLLDALVFENQTFAMVWRAVMYRNGQGTVNHQPDYNQAIVLLEKAIAEGDTEAMVWRARMHRNGQGTVNHQPNYDQAIVLLEKAIAGGDTDAMVHRAIMYNNGQGTENHRPDYDQAIVLLEKAIARGDTDAMIWRIFMYLATQDPASYPRVMELITQSLRKNSSKYIGHVKNILTSLVKNNHLEAEYFLFINLFKPDGYFPHDKTAALELFQEHPIQHFTAFCQACIDEIKNLTLTEEAHQVQIEHLNELLSLIPKSQQTPVVQAALNRLLAYAALFVSGNISVSYQYFRAVPEEYLTANDLFEISHQMLLTQEKSDDESISLALELAQHAQEKAPSDKEVFRLNHILSKLHLKKNMFTQSAEISPQEKLQLHARTQKLNRNTQQIILLKEYQGYLLLKKKFESQSSLGFFHFSAPVDKSRYIQDAVALLIQRLDYGNRLENLLIFPEIENARRNDEHFDQLLKQLIELPFLPTQNFKIGSL